MKIKELACEQGSSEWKTARLGIPTASQIDRILTPRTLKPSSQRQAYINELIAERMLGQPMDEANSAYMERGIALEDEARRWYEVVRAPVNTEIGFVTRTHPKGLVGASPDALVGIDGGLEIKCPSAVNHVGYMANHNGLLKDYRNQVQGSLWVTQRSWWDLVSYHPTMEPVIVRVKPERDWRYAFDDVIEQFLRDLNDQWQELERKEDAKWQAKLPPSPNSRELSAR